MTLNKIINIAAGVAMISALSACEGEKDLVIITDNLPIKTNTLYMVGSATPNGWDINNPTAMTPSEADPLVFDWEGTFYTGEIKLCLTPGSWDVGFIRPLAADTEIGKEEIKDQTFQMHAGDPDEKWKVTESGIYHVTFNLRNWTMSTTYLGAPAAEPVTPVETEALYIVGSATPAGWNIDDPFQLTKISKYVFQYEGKLTKGEMKAVCKKGDWGAEFFRPAVGGTEISSAGVADEACAYDNKSDDKKWNVTEAGTYRLTFDLEHYTLQVVMTAPDDTPKEDPVEEGMSAENIFMIGSATPNGWSLDNATKMTRDASDKQIFTWEGDLAEGEMKACIDNTQGFGVPFLRPSKAGVTIDASGVSASDFIFTSEGDDFKWEVKKAGKYRIVFNLKKYTIEVTYLS